MPAPRRTRHGRPHPAAGAPSRHGATTRSPCRLHGLSRESPQGPGDARSVHRSRQTSSASTDSPRVLLSSRGDSERVIAPRPRDGPLRAGSSAAVNSGCTSPRRRRPATGPGPTRCAGPAGERLRRALARRVSTLGLERRAKLLVHSGVSSWPCEAAACRAAAATTSSSGPMMASWQLRSLSNRRQSAMTRSMVPPFPGYRAIQHPGSPRQGPPPWTIDTPARLFRD